MNVCQSVMNASKLLIRQSNIIKYAVFVSLTVILANLLLQRYVNYGLLYQIRPPWYIQPTEAPETRFADFQFDPIERFDLENVKYGWIITAIAITVLALIIGC